MKTLKTNIAAAALLSALSVYANAADLGWLAEGIESGKNVPFSFAVDGSAAQIQFESAKKEALSDGGLSLDAAYRIAGEPVAVALRAEFSKERDFARLTVTLKGGDRESAELYEVRTLDVSGPSGLFAKGGVWMKGVRGGFIPIEDNNRPDRFPPDAWRPWDMDLKPGWGHRIVTGLSGRSTDNHIPVVLFSDEKSFLWAGSEWSGASEIYARNLAGFLIQIKLPTFAFRVMPGETITLPTVALGAGTGDSADGFNAIRRDIHDHYLPTINGEKPGPQVISQGLGAFPTYWTEENLYKEVDIAARIGCEAHILDAGWQMPPSTQVWGPYVGTWTPNAERFPRGIRAFADHIADKGMRSGIWLEPRFKDRSEVVREHPELFYPPQDGATLIDLSKPEARDWYFALLETFINDYGMKTIWFDFNCHPRKLFWDLYEKPGRRGLMELGFYQGYYEVMDRLLAKYPGLWIENCASGGHLMDLGLVRRSHSYWINDHSYNDDKVRSFRSGANLIFPAVYLQSGFFLSWKTKMEIPPADELDLGDGERLLNYFGSNLQFCQGLVGWPEAALETAKHYVDLYKQYRGYLEKDYYRPLPIPISEHDWDAWQFHDPETDSGVLYAFRMGKSAQAKQKIALQRIGNVAGYEFTTVAGQPQLEASPGGLVVGLEPGRAAMIHYRKR